MTDFHFELARETLVARADRSLFWPDRNLLCVSDLHLGKSERIARRSGVLLPPYDSDETLWRLESAIATTNPAYVICLGDSFDDLDAASGLSHEARLKLASLQAGREWIWIEGNHDPGPVELGGAHLHSAQIGPLAFRHIATSQTPELSGHFHPKYRIPGTSGTRPCFLIDHARVILPAFGAYTGGLNAHRDPVRTLMKPGALAILTGKRAIPVPFNPA